MSFVEEKKEVVISKAIFWMIMVPKIRRKSRSSHRRCSVKKDVLQKFEKFTGKHLCQSLFPNKKRDPGTAVNFAKFLRAPFLKNTSGRLLLKIQPIF